MSLLEDAVGCARIDDDVDAAVEGATRRGRVGGDRVLVGVAGHREVLRRRRRGASRNSSTAVGAGGRELPVARERPPVEIGTLSVLPSTRIGFVDVACETISRAIVARAAASPAA